MSKLELTQNTVKYQQGTNNVAFVFSCPGRKEKECKHVCAGTTGDNLQILIEELYTIIPEKFPSSNKDDYYITNASDKVHYKKLTGDTEATIDEIKEPQNLNRLKEELDNCDIIVCMGNKASAAVSMIQTHAQVIQGTHLSNSNLNRHFESKKTTACERKMDRIKQVGDLIIKNICVQKMDDK